MSLLDRKNRLNQKINDLKVDIQYMLDKKSSLHNIEEISKLESDKKEKILLLTKFHDDLKIINKDIRKLQQTENELIKVSRTLDSLEFHNAKRKKTETAIDKAKQEKEMRENAKDKYLLHLKKQNEYYEQCAIIRDVEKYEADITDAEEQQWAEDLWERLVSSCDAEVKKNK